MKLTLTLDEVSACAMALLSKAQEAEGDSYGQKYDDLPALWESRQKRKLLQ